MIPLFDRLAARLRAMFRKPQLDAELDVELAHHLDLLTEDYIGKGLSPSEARRRARLGLGGVEQTRELHRETRGLPWLEQLGQDLAYTMRMLRRERAFAIIAVLVLAIGVGLNTTVFSLINTVLLRPLPVPAPDRIVEISNGDPANSDRDYTTRSHQVDTWEGFIDQNRTFERIEYYDPFSLRQTYPIEIEGGTFQTSNLIGVSQGLFEMLGIVPTAGHLFGPEEAVGDGLPNLIITHQMWRQRFGSDPNVVGKTLRVNGATHTVIGVIPAADTFAQTFYPAVRIDAYMAITPENRRYYGDTLRLIGRLKPGVTPEAASADLALALDHMLTEIPDRDERHRAQVEYLQDLLTAQLKNPLLFVSVAAGLVLAIVVFNFGGLLLARGASQQSELAVRAALGADRGRLLRQMTTQCAVIVALGAGTGILLAACCLHLLAERSSIEIPLLQGVGLDQASVAFMLGISVLATVLCGVGPAWRLSQVGTRGMEDLKQEARGSTAGSGLTRLRSLLVVLEVALAAALATSSGLAVRSLQNVLHLDLGYEPDNLYALRIDALREQRELAPLFAPILDRVRAMPGVLGAGITDCLPIERDRSWGISPHLEGSDLEPPQGTIARMKVVSPELISTMGTILLQGRDFTRLDDTDKTRVIIVNESLANYFFPEGGAVGKQMMTGGYVREIVGIVADTRHAGPEAPFSREMYYPYRQQGSGSFDLMIRTALPLGTLRRDLTAALRQVDPTLPVTQLRPLAELVDRANSSRRMLTLLIGSFAAIALGLAGLGLYGVIAYTVTQRTKEIGIRMALGATSGAVRIDVVGRTLRLAAWGLGTGLLLSLGANRLMSSLLYGVSAFDPVIYGGAMVSVLGCALLAGFIPALRASRVDPMVALRSD